MDNDKQPSTWSIKLGLFTGPIMIILSLLVIFLSDKSKGLAYLILLFGIILTVASTILYFKTKNKS